MVIDTIKENLSVNKLVATKKEMIFVEGDMIVPDAKPDILNTICTSGVISIYKKEVLDDKIRIDGNINTYIMYIADDKKDKVRGLTTSLEFSENIQVAKCKQGMTCTLETKLKSIDAKVINGRKIGIKAAIDVEIKIYSNEDIEIINDIQNSEDIQMLRGDIKVNSLVGMGNTKIYAKDTINIDSADNLAEILKLNLEITDRDTKISYNKILTKAEAEIKIMYLTEDNRIGTTTTKIPIVGFIDIKNVTEENICDVNYEIRNIVVKPNSIEEHSIYIEIEIGVESTVYEDRVINLIQDIYSPTENLEFRQKKITTITDKKNIREIKQIRENIMIDGIDNRTICDVDIIPIVQNENREKNQTSYEGELELMFILSNDDLQIDTRNIKIPFNFNIESIECSENMETNMQIHVINKDFIVQDGGIVNANIDIGVDIDSYRSSNMNVIEDIQSNGEREDEDYSILMYIVRKGDTLWEIAKKFGSTINAIATINGIEDENNIHVEQKLFIPHYSRNNINNYV